MTVSVIVPVYNTSKFLPDCLDSLINQTFKDIEIICVNDGSTDNSLEILNNYAQKDSRIKIISQKNKGLSGARNTGIENINGEYTLFVDSDDWIDLNFIEKLHNAICETGADISAASIIRINKNLKKYRVEYKKQETFDSLEDKINICNIPKCCYVWNKLYKSEIIKAHKFQTGIFFEDIVWTPPVLKDSGILVTVPEINYYYRANSASIVKKKQSAQKQRDSYNAKKNIIKFFETNNLHINKKDKTITKSIIYLSNFVFLKVKEYDETELFLLFGCIPVYKKKIKTPLIKNNTFIVCELCSQSHSEVVPGYAKYLLDLGYHVSVMVNPDRYKEGLFERFKDENITLNKLTRKETKDYFKNNSLENVKGVLITTVGKICDCIHYDRCYDAFNQYVDRKKLFFVEHEASFAADKGTWNKNLITLRKLNYKGAESVVVNPHYFGEVNITQKNEITNFITIGAIKPNKKNSQMIVDAVGELVKKGYSNFKITVIGKGSLKHVPKEIKKYFVSKGRLPFKKMYDELEKADFMLMPYNENDPEHIRYNTSGTSGNFQLIYGFTKPCILIKSFAPINGLDETNSVLYNKDEDFAAAMETAINMKSDEYKNMQNCLKNYADKFYNESRDNLKNLIAKGGSVVEKFKG